MSIEERLARKGFEYFQRFGREPPRPYGISDEKLLELIERAIAAGDPEIGGHEELPPGADA